MDNFRRALIGTAVSALLLLAPAPVSAANDPNAVSVPLCAAYYVGHNTWSGGFVVSTNYPVTITESWGAKTKKQIDQFLARTTMRMSIDGASVTGNHWSAPYSTGDGWKTTWSIEHVAPPYSDEYVVKARLIFNQRVYDGAGSYLGRGPLLKCHVWGTS